MICRYCSYPADSSGTCHLHRGALIQDMEARRNWEVKRFQTRCEDCGKIHMIGQSCNCRLIRNHFNL